MKNRKIIFALILLIGAGLAGAFFSRDFFTTPTGGDYRNITDLESSYNADEEIAQAIAKLQTGQEKAAVISHNQNGQRQIALTFDGLTDRTTVQQILDLLKKYNARATFFVDGLQTAEDPQTVVNIKTEGQRVENYTLSGRPKMENMPVDRLVKDFCRAQKIIRVTTDQVPNLLKCNDTQNTDQLLRVAKACGFTSVVKSDVFLNVKQINSLPAADDFVGLLQPGSIVSVKLKTNVEPLINEPGKTDLRPAVDKQPGLKELPPPAEEGEKEIVEAVEKLLIALNKANYTTTYVESFSTTIVRANSLHNAKKDNGTAVLAKTAAFVQEQFRALFTCRTAYAAAAEDSRAKEIKFIPTTEPALSYTFGGLSNTAVVNDVLGKLRDLGIKATFFVTETEMKKYPETVRAIIGGGHEIGIAIRPKDGQTVDQTYQTIMRGRQILQERFGVAANLVKQPWGAVTEITEEAVAAAGCKLIGQSVNVVQSRHKDYTSADQVMREIFGKGVVSLARGEIVHFRMDYYTNDHLVGDLLEVIKQRKVDNIAYATVWDNPAHNPANDSQYVIKPVGEVINNTNFLYQYPVDLKNISPRLKNNGRLNVDQRNFLSELAKRYIGNEYVNDEDRMIGFSKMDIRRLDQRGLIHTKDNVIFLTFDDWGMDEAVNKILYVLRKHKVPGTFFVLTHNVLYNPNLLRIIASEGHDIGSHSDQHKPMVVRDPQTGRQVPTQAKEEYTKDLKTAYQKLLNVIGDVTVNGKPALTKFFRPPTLAISKAGCEALFDAGYEYIISGSADSYDYEASSVPQLVKSIKEELYTERGEVKKGSILVMHMGDSCVYTPMALDILLTANEAKADSDPSKFKVGRLSDYLTDGYSQISRKKYWELNKAKDLK